MHNEVQPQQEVSRVGVARHIKEKVTPRTLQHCNGIWYVTHELGITMPNKCPGIHIFF